ncbi:MAG: alanine--tRNA ligase [Myxococcales bacterium]|nr:alanine--tRNA ligase [Myxococcales bacterium]
MSSSRLTATEIRTTFLDYFRERGHEVVPSAPLVPQNDPTLMFVNAGMVQFKDVFTGKDVRGYKRACSSQKCIRISGKHNDLENVGVTARHHTFFEMLGNFSFGDYFKEEAIAFAWELLTKVYGIPKERLVVTVFAGEKEFAADDEAAALWRKVTGFGDDRVLRLGMADNFWSMGDTGPCGPCSEIHYFHGDTPDLGRFGAEPGLDGAGWTEIWNLVFMQYDRATPGAAVTPLPAPSIDTGAGLERLAGVLQGVRSNYDCDLLRRLVDCAARLAGKRYGASAAPDDMSMRVIADHARTTAFLIAEGVMPDRQKREYVLRRVMRRAIRHGHRLGIEKPFLHEVALEVVAAMSDEYPELARRKELILRVTEGEEVRFRATLKRGMKILDERFDDLRRAGQKRLPAEVTADMYTTFGFPVDLTEIIAAEQGYTADAAGAEAIIKKTEEVDGPIDPTAAVDPVHRAFAAAAGKTRFSGYDREEDVGTVVALALCETGANGRETRRLVERAEAGSVVELVTDVTPFYAESGGQVGDVGVVAAPEGGALEVAVLDTHRPFGDTTVHRARVVAGTLAVGQQVALRVSHDARAATRRNHSATHLLHWALRTVLGEHAQQKGSRVGPDVLRFDFAHNHAMTREELLRVEDLVNGKILDNAPVETAVLPIDEARRLGAVAIFEEKYGDVVRMLTMTSDSIELCGGTHCRALGDIGLFKIASEGGTAAGVRRILAVTGKNALAHLRAVEDDLARARVAAKAQGGDLADKILKIVAREKQLEKRISELEKQLLAGAGSGAGATDPTARAEEVGGVRLLALRAPDATTMPSLRELCEQLRDKLAAGATGGSAVLAASVTEGKAQLVLAVSKSATGKLKAGDLIRPIAKLVGGSGGGRPDMAQAGGTQTGGIDDAVAAFYVEAKAMLAR